jgi:hypothetical protein
MRGTGRNKSSVGGNGFLLTLSAAVALCLAFALGVVAPAVAAGGGNSDNAKLCQHGGWQNWVRSDGTRFENTGGCVSYAAQGGTLTTPAKITGVTQLACNAGAGTQLLGVTGTGFRPNTQMTFTASSTVVVDNHLNDSPFVFTDATGSFNSGTFPPGTHTFILTISGVIATLHVTATDGVQTASFDTPIPFCTS